MKDRAVCRNCVVIRTSAVYPDQSKFRTRWENPAGLPWKDPLILPITSLTASTLDVYTVLRYGDTLLLVVALSRRKVVRISVRKAF